ncbi:MAG: 4-hydroxy-tetrahydrodipicolinate synthase [Bernardetiaceae bacterium]
MKKMFRGTYTAIVTPMTADNIIDWQAFTQLIERQIAGGIDGIVFVGTTGESPTLSHAEHEEILYRSVEIVRGRCQVIHGTGSNNTVEAVTFAQAAAKAGADAQLVVNPYYNKPTQEGLFAHFSAIADATDLPVVLYNIQGRSAINLKTDTLLRLAEHPHIVGVKEASGDIAQMMEVIRHTSEDFYCLGGDDALALPFMAMGGDGIVSVISNAVPAAMTAMVRQLLEGDFERGRKAFYDLLPLMHFSFIESNPVPMKELLAQLGYIRADVRLPLCRGRAETIAAAAEIAALVRSLEPEYQPAR